jgi:NlpC/P60 family putative phage cell wall peptidase
VAAEAVHRPAGPAHGPVAQLGGGDDHAPGQVRLGGAGLEAAVQVDEGQAGRVRLADQVAVAEERLVGAEPQRAPAYSRDWAEASGEELLARAARAHLIEVGPADFQPGDVLLFRYRDRYPAKHAAIVGAPASMVHAHDGAAVAEVAISPWWRRRLAYAFRFPGVIDSGVTD